MIVYLWCKKILLHICFLFQSFVKLWTRKYVFRKKNIFILIDEKTWIFIVIYNWINLFFILNLCLFFIHFKSLWIKLAKLNKLYILEFLYILKMLIALEKENFSYRICIFCNFIFCRIYSTRNFIVEQVGNSTFTWKQTNR